MNAIKCINLDINGNLGNRMLQYAYCRSLQQLVPGSMLHGYCMPEFGLVSPKAELTGRVLNIKGGHQHDMQDIAYKLNQGIYDSLNFEAFVQRLQYFSNRDVFGGYFPSTLEVDRTYLGPNYITVNVRGREVLRNTHRDYGPVPVNYFRTIVESTKLEPVIMGQLEDNRYSEEIRQLFKGCIFLEHKSPLYDFQTLRNSTNIVLSVSTFSWIAAWISKSAQTIHLPIYGFLNPKQRPDIDLLPVNDERYRFYQFPHSNWEASPEQLEALFAKEPVFRNVDRFSVKALY